jgi:hypothetical protein
LTNDPANLKELFSVVHFSLFHNYPVKTRMGDTKSPIWSDDEIAIPIHRFILFFMAKVTELTCSAALYIPNLSIHKSPPPFKKNDSLSNNGQYNKTNKSFV